MKIQLGQPFSFTRKGRRDNQEDSRFPDSDKPSATQRYFVVCDGVGGSEKGEVASRTVCSAISKAMSSVDLDKAFSNEAFSKVFDTAYDALDRKSDNSNREMATTMTFVCFHAGGCTMAHIGDSRIYHFRPGEGIIYRSEDHALVVSMVRNGVITPEEAEVNPQKHVITRYMAPVESDGTRCSASVMLENDVKAGDYFLLCSDGVSGMIDDDSLIQVVLNPELSDERKMTEIARLCEDSDDNNTATLIPGVAAEYDNVIADETSPEGPTKRLKNPSKGIEDIESNKGKNGSRFSNWILNIFK